MIKAIVVDDEPLSLDKLEKLLTNSGQAEVAGKFTKPLEALAFLENNKVDAAFLDIEMPDMNGIELSSRILDLQESVSVVFVTAYNQYAVEAFRLNALDYLLKPVSAGRLADTLRRITEQMGLPLHAGGLHVRCFGKFCVSEGKQEIRFRTEKAAELLAFMIDGRGTFISRSRIIDSLWEDFDGDRAVVHFNTTLHYVKKALLPYGIRISVLYDRGSYRLDTGGMDCDYLKFCAFAEKAEAAGHKSIPEYEETVTLYKGEYLSGWDYDWAAVKRLWLLEQFIGLLLEMAEYYKQAQNYPKALKWLKTGMLHEPLHRELNYRLIEVLLLTHERALATKHYDLYRNGLAKKLGQEPDASFKKLLR